MYEASNLDFLLTWFSHCYSRFLLLTFPCYIFAHSFTINFTFTVLQVCFLSKAYSKLIIHHCFLQPSFSLKIFVLTSLSFGRSNSLNSFLRLHEYFFTCSFLKTVFQLGLGFLDYIPFSQKSVNIFLLPYSSSSVAEEISNLFSWPCMQYILSNCEFLWGTLSPWFRNFFRICPDVWFFYN